eukprot:362012-Chlamydomonas_euryale.AAC.6
MAARATYRFHRQFRPLLPVEIQNERQAAGRADLNAGACDAMLGQGTDKMSSGACGGHAAGAVVWTNNCGAIWQMTSYTSHARRIWRTLTAGVP